MLKLRSLGVMETDPWRDRDPCYWERSYLPSWAAVRTRLVLAGSIPARPNASRIEPCVMTHTLRTSLAPPWSAFALANINSPRPRPRAPAGTSANGASKKTRIAKRSMRNGRFTTSLALIVHPGPISFQFGRRASQAVGCVKRTIYYGVWCVSRTLHLTTLRMT
jgi:hypothetical protein